jgi:WD40 repeat protein
LLQVHDRTIYSNIHRALVNSIRYASWLPGGFNCASASSDGTVKLFDVETGESLGITLIT